MEASEMDATKTITDHINLVGELLGLIAGKLIIRGELHDRSKFDPIEKGPLDAMKRLQDEEGHAPYGTPEYARRTAILKPMIEHHFAANDHHPEHFENGIADMDLLQLVEMLCDWRAANLERDAGAPMNLSFSVSRFNIDPMLASVMRNTVRNLGWDAK